VVAPPRTPAPIASKLAAAIAEAMQEPAVAAKLRDLAVITLAGTPADTAAFLKTEVERWREVVVATGAKSE
jgi:tripartite-type tricarboxylate transporter receptor subunit TctC